MSWTANAKPTKEFFINMITRDIGLDECIFDLLDNSIDGAKRGTSNDPEKRYAGFHAKIIINKDQFILTDNCGGISLNDAVNYAFHFGRRSDAPPTEGQSIGLYGIGMKRAIFKMGKDIKIKSATELKSAEAFQTHIVVDDWAATDDWDFTLNQWDADFVGTEIEIKSLREGTSSEFSDEMFLNKLRRDIGKYYSFIIQDGFEIFVNGKIVAAYDFRLRHSSEIAPISLLYSDNVDTDVTVRITAGLAGAIPDDVSDPELGVKDAEYWGWFVVCNDRVVLAGDKTDKTVWGDSGFAVWHPQYNGFMGIVEFSSSSPRKLPWTTTKRQIDDTTPIYRRAVVKMKEATRTFTTYTTARKADLDKARQSEIAAPLTPIRNLATQPAMKLPVFQSPNAVQMATISFQRPKKEVARVAESLGNKNMTNRQVGLETFKYYLENEVGGSDGLI